MYRLTEYPLCVLEHGAAKQDLVGAERKRSDKHKPTRTRDVNERLQRQLLYRNVARFPKVISYATTSQTIP